MPTSPTYEAYLFTHTKTDALHLRDVPAGLPVAVQIGEAIKLTGKVIRHRAAEGETAVIGFKLTGDAETSPLTSAAIRAWFADALAALLACPDTPAYVCNALTEAVNEIGNRAGAYALDSDLARHILKRSFAVAAAAKGDDDQ